MKCIGTNSLPRPVVDLAPISTNVFRFEVGQQALLSVDTVAPVNKFLAQRRAIFSDNCIPPARLVRHPQGNAKVRVRAVSGTTQK